MQDQLEMMLQGAISLGKDVQAEWYSGRLARVKTADPGRGRRIWRVIELKNGALHMHDEPDTSDL